MIRRAKEKFISQYDSTVGFFADALTRMQTHEGFKRYFKNTGWLFIGRIGSMIITFLVGVYFARYLGPAQFGLLSYAVSFVGLFAFINGFGIDGILARELVQKPDKRDEILGSALALKIAGNVVLSLLIGVALVILKSEAVASILIIIITASYFFQAFNVIDSFFQSQVLSKKVVVAQLSVSLVLAVIKLVSIYLKLPLVFFAFLYIIESVLLASIYILTYISHKLSILNWRPRVGIMISMFKNSWPFMFSGAAVLIYMKIDQIMIKQMLSNNAVGLYSAAVKLSEVWYFIPSIICTSVFPAIVNAKKRSDGSYERRMSQLYALLLWISIGIAAFVTLFAGIIISMIYGHAYVSSADVLRIYIWAGVPTFIGLGLSQYLVIENLLLINFILSFLGAVFNIALNLYLIPAFGINGAAIATLISYSLVVLGTVLFKHTRGQLTLMRNALLFK